MKYTLKNAKKAVKTRKRHVLKAKRSASPRPFSALERNMEIDLFGEFDTEEKKLSTAESVKLRLLKAFKRMGNFFGKAVSALAPKKPPVSASLIVGAICGVISVTVIAGVITLFSFFGSYGGSYTVVKVPDFTSMSESDALNFRDDIFDFSVEYRTNPNAAEGCVISQSPLPDTERRLYKKSKKIALKLIVNCLKETVEVPQTVGLSLRDVNLSLKNLGFKVKVTEEYSDVAPRGEVIFCSQNSGTLLSEGSLIVLKASMGKRPTYQSMPKIIGMSEIEACEELQRNGFEIGKIDYENSPLPAGTVISQEFEAGSALLKGTEISFSVSGGYRFEQ